MTRLLLLALLVGCGKGADDSSGAADDDTCGDPDGPGGDTGDVPSLLGAWTSSFAQDFYDDSCTADNLGQTTEGWIGAFTVTGSVENGFLLEFTQTDDEKYYGRMDPFGGVTFSGLHTHSAGPMYAQFGGIVYHDPYTDRDVIEGAATLGLDADGDAQIDCLAKGSWKAFKSGL